MSKYLENLENFRAAYQKINFGLSVESTSMGLLAPVLCRTINARTAVEVGIAYGWMTGCLCAGVEAVAGKDGVVIGVDENEDFCNNVRDNVISEFDVQKKLIHGDSRQVDWKKELEKYDRTEIDIASIDGNHLGDVPLTDLTNVLDLMSPAGVILMHDYGHMYEDVVSAVNAVLQKKKWRLFQLPQNISTNETGCCLLQRDKFLAPVEGEEARPDHIVQYEQRITTKTHQTSKLAQSVLKDSKKAPVATRGAKI